MLHLESDTNDISTATQIDSELQFQRCNRGRDEE